MTSDRETLNIIGAWMEDGRTRLPGRVLDAVLDQLATTPQHRSRWSAWRIPTLKSFAGLSVIAVALAAMGIIGLTLGGVPAVGPVASPTPTAAASPFTPEPSVALSPEPVAGAIPCKKPSSEAGVVLGCSRDGTRLLIQKDRQNLFVLHPDGSETQVTDQLSGFDKIPFAPRGAALSPDGSRVVFAGLTEPYREGKDSCHNGALFAVDADGGRATMLFKSHIPPNGIISYPVYSPDGTQIAVADGYCDNSHGVWVMNADGSDPRQIVPTGYGPLGATHVHGLEWSKAGDRLAVVVDDGLYTFAPDGTGFAKFVKGPEFCVLVPECLFPRIVSSASPVPSTSGPSAPAGR